MVVFDLFWQLLKERNITTYDLEYKYGLNPADISRLKHNHNYTLKSINRFCELLSCQPGEILLYKAPGEILVPSGHPGIPPLSDQESCKGKGVFL